MTRNVPIWVTIYRRISPLVFTSYHLFRLNVLIRVVHVTYAVNAERDGYFVIPGLITVDLLQRNYETIRSSNILTVELLKA